MDFTSAEAMNNALFKEQQSSIDYANSTISFPQKLFTLLETDNGASAIIKWQPHGLCFRIYDPETFASEVVPKYFKRK